MSIEVFDRARGLSVEEKVLGGSWVNWAYGTAAGRALVGIGWIQRLISRVVGRYQSHPVSHSSVENFIREFGINMPEFEVPSDGFETFADFFVRSFKSGARSFPKAAGQFGSPAEGRLSVFPIDHTSIPLCIKGVRLPLHELIDILGDMSEKFVREFVGGYAWVFRLCPIDYHQFHFADSGIPSMSHLRPGLLHSVNPKAQEAVPQVFLKNERQICLFKSDHFGNLMYIEVGALCVGKIQQRFTPHRRVERGDSKGLFEFGGSTLILFSQKGRLNPDEDLISKTNNGVESLVRLGEVIGRAPAN